MEKQEVKSKWDELAREIGAEVSPEREQIVEAGPPPPQSGTITPIAPKPPATHAATSKPAAGWDNLANEFGLPVPEPVAEPSVEKAVLVAKHEVVAESVEAAEVEIPRHERPPSRRPPQERQERHRGERHREQRPRDDEDVPRDAAREQSRETRETRPTRHREEREHREHRGRREQRGQRPRRDEREGRPRRDQREEPEPLEAREQSQHRDQREERDRREERDESAKPAPAVSLWQKIFGAPAEPPTSPVESSPTEARGTSDVADEPASREAGDFRETRYGGESEAEDRREGPSEFEAAQDEGESTEQRQRRPRRRRRGRGGRGERSADVKAGERRRPQRKRDESVHADDFDELAPDDEDTDAELADELSVDSGDEDSNGESDKPGPARSRSALQRSIPSWDEAIGYIVELNMQSRSQRRQSHSSSRHGPSRGRPSRGRRKK